MDGTSRISREAYVRNLCCSDASWCSSGCKAVSPVSGTCPVATVVISGGGAGDQSAGSLEVKVPVGRAKAWSAPTGGRASRQVVANANLSKPRKRTPHGNRRVRSVGSAETFTDSRRPAWSVKELGTNSRSASRGLRGRHADRE